MSGREYTHSCLTHSPILPTTLACMSRVFVRYDEYGPRTYFENGKQGTLACEHGSIVHCTTCERAASIKARTASLAAAETKDHAPAAAVPIPVSSDAALAACRFNLIEGVYKLKAARERDAITRRFTSCEPIEPSPALDELIRRLERELEFLYAPPARTEPVIPDPRV